MVQSSVIRTVIFMLYDDRLYHYGIPGMKWGVRKFIERHDKGKTHRDRLQNKYLERGYSNKRYQLINGEGVLTNKLRNSPLSLIGMLRQLLLKELGIPLKTYIKKTQNLENSYLKYQPLLMQRLIALKNNQKRIKHQILQLRVKTRTSMVKPMMDLM